MNIFLYILLGLLILSVIGLFVFWQIKKRENGD